MKRCVFKVFIISGLLEIRRNRQEKQLWEPVKTPMIGQDKLKYRNKTHPQVLFLCHTILALPKFLLNASNLAKPTLRLMKRFHIIVMYMVLNTFHMLNFDQEFSNAVRAGSLHLPYLLINANKYFQMRMSLQHQ